MSMTFRGRWIDLANLFVAKGANFILTSILFYLMSRGMRANEFAEFGYWWSMALMVGGMLCGGVASASIRALVVHGSLAHLRPVLIRVTGFLVLLLGLALGIGSLFQAYAQVVRLGVVLTLFGISIQVLSWIFSLMRAMEKTKVNVLASIISIGLIPVLTLLIARSERDMAHVFGALASGFFVTALVLIVVFRESLGAIWKKAYQRTLGGHVFFSNVVLFTLINVFSYATVNMDFTIFRWFGVDKEFQLFANSKIYFERFILPLMLVFSGAVSLKVLRHSDAHDGRGVRMVLGRWTYLTGAVLTVALFVIMGYYVFFRFVRHESLELEVIWVCLATLGYIFYTANGILFDVLAVQSRMVSVLCYVMVFLALALIIQWVAIARFSVAGWAVGWFFFNFLVLVLLARQTVDMKSKN